MRTGRAAGWLLIAAAIACGLASTTAAAASPYLTVAPSSWLHNGQHVTLHWSELSAPDRKVFFFECTSLRAIHDGVCDDGTEGAVQSSVGSGSTDYVVHDHVFRTVCTDKCLILASGDYGYATAAIAFGSALPFTGSPVGIETGVGTSLAAAGLLLLVRARRRRV